MSPSLRFVLQLVDPRGRYDRTEFIWAAVNLIGAQLAFALGLWLTGASLLGWRGLVANAVFAWLGYAAICKRLHDLGHGAWWLLGRALTWLAVAFAAALGIAFVVGPAALEMGTPAFWLMFAGLMLPPAGLALWLHLAQGQPSANRYGPPPGHDRAGLQPA
jgi:uncharacterized membrane protein YhaH (DUF805 family)